MKFSNRYISRRGMNCPKAFGATVKHIYGKNNTLENQS